MLDEQFFFSPENWGCVNGQEVSIALRIDIESWETRGDCMIDFYDYVKLIEIDLESYIYKLPLQ